MADVIKLSDKRLEIADGVIPDGLTHFWECDDNGIVQQHEFRGIIRAPIGKQGYDLVGSGVAVYQCRAFLQRDNALAFAIERAEQAKGWAEDVQRNVRTSFELAGVDIEAFLAARAVKDAAA